MQHFRMSAQSDSRCSTGVIGYKRQEHGSAGVSAARKNVPPASATGGGFVGVPAVLWFEEGRGFYGEEKVFPRSRQILQGFDNYMELNPLLETNQYYMIAVRFAPSGDDDKKSVQRDQIKKRDVSGALDAAILVRDIEPRYDDYGNREMYCRNVQMVAVKVPRAGNSEMFDSLLLRIDRPVVRVKYRDKDYMKVVPFAMTKIQIPETVDPALNDIDPSQAADRLVYVFPNDEDDWSTVRSEPKSRQLSDVLEDLYLTFKKSNTRSMSRF